MPRQQMNLREFLSALQQVLGQLPPDDVRDALLTHAIQLPAHDRQGFLGIFSQFQTRQGIRASAAVQASIPRYVDWPEDRDTLLEDIEAFAEKVQSGDYFDGFGWDADIYEERSFGDESWVDAMVDLFHDAGQAFLAGRLGLARAAYRGLFDTLELDEEVGTFSGPEPAVSMLDIDLDEAMSRYLRTVYETTDPVDRPAELFMQWRYASRIGAFPSLEDLRGSDSPDLPDLDGFLPQWITELQEQDQGEKLTRTLLVEAVLLAEGVDGLGRLARAEGPGRGPYYSQWVSALHTAGRISPAIEAAREALLAPGIGAYARAGIADQLAELAAGDPETVLGARRTAWRSRPSALRLRFLHHAATQFANPVTVMTGELDFIQDGELHDEFGAGLYSRVMLLAGKVDQAAKALASPPVQQPSWVAAQVLVPYLLLSGCRALPDPGNSHSWAGNLLKSVDESGWTALGDPDIEMPPTFSELFAGQLAEEQADTTAAQARLDAALAQISREVDSIVSRTDRDRYARAADLLAHGAAALSLAGGEQAGRAWIAEWLATYPRHVAFRREVERAQGSYPS